MKHFEHIWNDAEEISENFNQEIPEIIKVIKDNLDDLNFKLSTKDNPILALLNEHDLLGEILFDIAKISKKLNINVYHALKDIVEEEKIELLENSEE